MNRWLHPDAAKAAMAYLGTTDLGEPLGSGRDGVVYSTSEQSAIKVFGREDKFAKELAVYERLAAHKVTKVCGFNVPRLIGSSRTLRVIEMSIVQPPYILDFARSTLDFREDWGKDVLREWKRQIKDEFEDRWPQAMAIYDELRNRYGIYHEDISPRNVNFGDEGK